MAPVTRAIDVLHVDDDEDFLELASTFLARESEAVRVETEPDPRRARERLLGEDAASFDCVVSDLEMPGLDGLSLLESIRGRHEDLPFVLFTGKGSEEVASDAIAAGVTDYLQKSGGTDQFAILANRIENAVEGHRARQEHERAERRLRKLLEESVDVVAVLEPDGSFQYLSPAAEAVIGYRPEDLFGENGFEYLHPDDRDRVRSRFVELLEGEAERVSVRCQFRADDGSWVDLDVRGRNLLDDPDVGGILVHGQDATGRVQRERELERYETMVNRSGDMIYTTDEEGHLTSVNDAAVSFLGYPRESLVGQHVSTIVTDASADRGREAALELGEADDADGRTIELEFVTAEGETVPAEAHLTLLTGADGGYHGTVGVVRDISARKEREETFRALHVATHDVVAAGTRDEIIEVLVDTARDVLGLPLVGLWLYDEEERALLPAVYPDDPAVPDEPPVYREGDGLSWEAFVEGEVRAYGDLGEAPGRYNPDTSIGSELIVPVGRHGVLNSGSVEPGAFDGTDRYTADILARTAAAALDRVERETVLERLHAATRDLMAAGDPEAIAERTLETASEILGHRDVVVRLLGGDGQELEPVAVTEKILEEIDTPRTYRVGEGTAGAAYALGEAVSFDVGSLEDDVDRGSVESVLCVPMGAHGVLTIAHTDVDAFDESDVQLARILAANAETALDRVDRERELARQNEQLEEFASVASHDLRNPLNVAMSHVRMLRGQLGDGIAEDDGAAEVAEANGVVAPPNLSDRLASVDDALERMDTLVDDVLSLSRGGEEVIDPEPVSLASVAEDAWATAGMAPGELSVEGELGVVACDRSRLQQVLENLFRNARDHASEDVTVKIGRTEEGFYVEDDGPGIPEREREDVFESRFTTAADGTGFGLTIVRRIVEAHGWTVDVGEGRHGGARFEVSGVE